MVGEPDLGHLVVTGSGPLSVAIAFADAVRRRDPGAARAQLESGAQVLTADGTEVSDPDSIAFVLAQMTAPENRLDIRTGRTVVKGDVALCTQTWRLQHPSEAACFERTSHAFFVLRRSAGRWRIVIAAPWG